MGGSGPALYTVEEAAKVLRIGRTKAYALTQEWRATGGRSGLPVVDFGNVLRVPRAALEELLGGVELGPAPTGRVAPAVATAPGGDLAPAAGDHRPDRLPGDEHPEPQPAPAPAAAPPAGRRPARSRATPP